MEALQKQITFENIPKCLGGGFELYNEKFDFDLSETGVFWYEGCPPDPKKGSGKAIGNGNGTSSPRSSSPVNGGGNKKDFHALHKTGVRFPTTLTAIPEGSEDASSRRVAGAAGANSSTSNKSGKSTSSEEGFVGRTKRSLQEVVQAVRGAPVFSGVLLTLLTNLSLHHWDLVVVVVLPAMLLFLLLVLVFDVDENAWEST